MTPGFDPDTRLWRGDRVQALRVESELSIEQLAAKIGVAPKILAHWERRRSFPYHPTPFVRVPSRIDIAMLCEALNTYDAYLTGHIDRSHRPPEPPRNMISLDYRRGLMEDD
jgi:transcriptional regulator with XRE-family HTH domain